MTTRPPEPPDGQDDPPDVRTAIHAVVRVFDELHERHDLDPDLVLRIAALRSALARLRTRLDQEEDTT